MHRYGLAFAAGFLLCVTGCSGSSQSSSSSSSSTTTTSASAPAHTALPSNQKTPITFSFTDVSVATDGANTLRLGFDVANKTQDSLLCDPSEFYLQLGDGTVLAADQSADNSCTPDSVDPGATGKSVMYFDLPSSYTGPASLFIVINDAVVGQSATTIK